VACGNPRPRWWSVRLFPPCFWLLFFVAFPPFLCRLGQLAKNLGLTPPSPEGPALLSLLCCPFSFLLRENSTTRMCSDKCVLFFYTFPHIPHQIFGWFLTSCSSPFRFLLYTIVKSRSPSNFLGIDPEFYSFSDYVSLFFFSFLS